MAEFKHLDLFSGIGGFSLGFEAAGFETVGFAEIDAYSSRVLKKHWPKIVNYGDVRNVPPVRCHVLTGGFPCQPFSVAGFQDGVDDARFIWPAMFHAIKSSRPAWVVCENVPGILGLELDRVLDDLEIVGYETQSFIIPACGVGARHLRNRVWIVAHNASFDFKKIASGFTGTDNIGIWKRLAATVRLSLEA